MKFCVLKIYKEAVAFLQDTCKCCKLCSLRFVGESASKCFINAFEEPSGTDKSPHDVSLSGDVSQLQQDDEVEAQASNSGTEKASCGENVQDICPACLGLMKPGESLQMVIDQVVKTIRESGHQFKSFKVNLSLPVCLMVRQRAVLVALKEKFSPHYVGVEDSSVTPLKDVWKWVVSPALSRALGKPLSQKAAFKVDLTWVAGKEQEADCHFLREQFPSSFKPKAEDGKKLQREIYTKTSVSTGLDRISDVTFAQLTKCPPACPADPVTVSDVSCEHAPIYIGGRYNKYSRALPQTPWFVDGKRKMESSLEERILAQLAHHVHATGHNFTASGREDVDVRMLGRGRPFSVEFLNPKVVEFTTQQMEEIEKAVNTSCSDVAVRHLQVVKKRHLTQLKQGEEDKRKLYSALCYSETPVSEEKARGLEDIKDLVLQQQTPIRVLHRRPQAVRERTVHAVRLEKPENKELDDRHFTLLLTTQAGTYVKEFVHGDFGRTRPCLGDLLGTTCDILELDVQDVELEWPLGSKPGDDSSSGAEDMHVS